MRYFKFFIFALVAVFSSCQSKGSDKLVVMSYNIRNSKAQDGENDWEHRKKATMLMLNDIKPDIFGVQEAYPNQVEYITENCPRYASYGVGRDDGISKGEHMSIFYNTECIEMIHGGTFWLSETPDEPSKGWDAHCRRTATWALFKDKRNGRQFYYVNTHLDHKGKEAQRKSLALIVDRIADMNKESYPMVLTGDFNVLPSDSCLVDLNARMLSARETAQVTDGRPSFNGFGLYDPTEIDYIYYSDFSSCADFEVITQQYEGIEYTSDHYPIVSTLVY